MLTLALDTSSSAGSLAVLRDEKLIGSVATWTSEIYSSRIFRHLEFLLKELSLGLDEFDLFAVAAGPGSFTGLRVGLAAVKGWAEVFHKPIAAVSGLEAVAVQSHSPVPLLVPVLDARRGQVYFGLYRRIDAPDENALALEGEECVMTPEEFLETLRVRGARSELSIVTPTQEVLAGAMSRSETRFRVETVSAMLAAHVGQLGLARARRGEVADSLTLDANYVRRTDAELHWKGSAGT
ncbi:MAG TPA: tRNA (adenosine(37)-N6)-threonylcarbamoyltransferase complex dimerization subunit type 1 TsaB [Candidatus Acidoferrales bacterium]|nr:tRNA (adenosine(37)-N6)-threonylcarbamoyltransferase complex dimerization subunit type 1 TsaB [Candidatus Acidoferrales bacterium]